MLPKGVSSREILATLQPYEYALVHLTPLDKRVLLHTGVPVLQKDMPLHKLRQQF
jgi:hypothetical protein